MTKAEMTKVALQLARVMRESVDAAEGCASLAAELAVVAVGRLVEGRLRARHRAALATGATTLDDRHDDLVDEVVATVLRELRGR
jgi:hypothetical protein